MVKPNSEAWLNAADNNQQSVGQGVPANYLPKCQDTVESQFDKCKSVGKLETTLPEFVAGGLVLSLVNCHGIKNLDVLDWPAGIWHSREIKCSEKAICEMHM